MPSASMTRPRAATRSDASSQGAHLLKEMLCGAILPKVDPAKIRVVTPDVGGGFGMKVFLYPEYVMPLWAARGRHGR